MKNNSENVRNAGWSYLRLCVEYDYLLGEFSKLHKAHNSHDELVDVLKEVLTYFAEWNGHGNYSPMMARIDSALLKANGSLQKSSS